MRDFEECRCPCSRPVGRQTKATRAGVTLLMIAWGTTYAAMPASGQQISLAIGSGNSTPGGVISLNLSLADSGSTQPSSVEWVMSYPAVDVSSVNVSAGSAATSGSKTITCNTAVGSATCIASGLNDSAIPPGTLANISFQIAAAPKDISIPIRLSTVMGARADGTAIAGGGTGGNITLVRSSTLTGLKCMPSSITTPASATCGLTLNAAAPNTFTAAIQSNNSLLSVPASITIFGGTAGASFPAAAPKVSSIQSATITAALGGSSITSSLTLLPPAPSPILISELTCTPTTLSSGGSSACNVTLAQVAASKLTVSLTSNKEVVTLPAGVAITSGSSSARFSVQIGSISSNQSAVVTAASPNNSQTLTLNLTPSSRPVSSLSIWAVATRPGRINTPDSNAVELGVKFRSDVAGKVTAVRFYKGSQNHGTHAGHLWSSTGALLASVTFTQETSRGWQQANFSSPVAIQPDITYIISYFCPRGYYSSDNYYFNSTVNTPPLSALQNGTEGGNGVYRYGSASGFPNQTWKASNYWVDLVFSPTFPGSASTLLKERR